MRSRSKLIDRSFISDTSSEAVGDPLSVNVGKVVGTCMNKDIMRLKRLVFRATRGNALMVTKNEGGISNFRKIKTPKSVFIIIFQEGKELRNKIETVAMNFSKNNYRIPRGDISGKLNKIQGKIDQTKQLIKLTTTNLNKYLENCNID